LKLNDAYEKWEFWSGIFLLSIFILMSVQYFVIKCSSRSGKHLLSKSYFRKTHHLFYYITVFVFTIHSYQITQILFLIVYIVFYKYSKISIRNTYYRINRNGKIMHKLLDDKNKGSSYILELVVETEVNVPANFGYFVSFAFEGIFSNYTIITLSNKCFMMRIANSTITRKFIEHINTTKSMENWVLTNSGEMRRSRDGQWVSLNKDDYNMNFYGFYRSFDHNIATKKKLICFVKSTGRVVSDSVLSYSLKRSIYEKIIIINRSRSKYSEYSDIVRPVGKYMKIKWLDFKYKFRGISGNDLLTIFNLEGELSKSDLRELLESNIDEETELLIVDRTIVGKVTDIYYENVNQPRFDINNVHVEDFSL